MFCLEVIQDINRRLADGETIRHEPLPVGHLLLSDLKPGAIVGDKHFISFVVHQHTAEGTYLMPTHGGSLRIVASNGRVLPKNETELSSEYDYVQIL